MNSYSKMKAFGTSKSRSVDFSELLPSFPAQTPKPITRAGVEVARPEDGSCLEKETDDYSDGDRFGVILGRSSSVSTTSDRFRFDRQKNAGIVKRVFSMRRSSSVSERYCRIHDQSVTLSSQGDDDEEGSAEGMGSARKKKNRGVNIFKACKRLLGL
ncbi:hypothetical protein BT93_H1572 [Corymbia citriodora subsp. variegata]|nr:hypothetical protein BT93_H1572 [Corymbia citriodora subsp. variegata]